MSDFFKTLFKLNWANVGKAVVGAAAGALTYPDIAASLPFLPPAVVLLISVAVGIGSALGLHEAHVTEPPKPPLGS